MVKKNSSQNRSLRSVRELYTKIKDSIQNKITNAGDSFVVSPLQENLLFFRFWVSVEGDEFSFPGNTNSWSRKECVFGRIKLRVAENDFCRWTWGPVGGTLRNKKCAFPRHYC